MSTRAKDNLIVVSGKGNKAFSQKIIGSLGEIADGLIIKKSSDIEAYSGEFTTSDRQIPIDLSGIVIENGGPKFVTVRQQAKILSDKMGHLPEDRQHEIDTGRGGDLEWGNLVHRLLFYAPFKSTENAIEIAASISSDAKLQKVARIFASSELNAKMLQSEVFSEIPLLLRTADLTIIGRADAIILNPPTVLDYKTGKPDASEIELYATQLNIYRLALARWLGIDDADVIAQIVWIDGDIYVQDVEYNKQISTCLSDV